MKTCKQMRYENARALAKDGPARFAETLSISPQQANTMIGPNPKRGIGDAQARLIEELFEKEEGWLDHDHSSEGNISDSTNTGQKEPLSDEANQLIRCVRLLDKVGKPAHEMFDAHRQIMSIAVRFSQVQYSHQALTRLAEMEDLLGRDEISERQSDGTSTRNT